MSKFLADLLTDHQGRNDEQALISLLAAAVFLGLEIYAVVVRGQSFDAFGFGAGIGTLLGATSAGFGLRARWTPDQSVDPTIDPTIDPITGRYIGEQNASNSA